MNLPQNTILLQQKNIEKVDIFVVISFLLPYCHINLISQQKFDFATKYYFATNFILLQKLPQNTIYLETVQQKRSSCMERASLIF